jgi:hypothetical protein
MSVRSIIRGVAGWFGGERTRVSRPGARRTALRLEALEQRDVLSPLAGDIVQTVTDLNRLSGFYRASADLSLIQNDVRNLVYAFQAGRAPQAVYQLQYDMWQTTSRFGAFAPLVSNDPAMTRDVNALLRDVNPGPGQPIGSPPAPWGPVVPNSPFSPPQQQLLNQGINANLAQQLAPVFAPPSTGPSLFQTVVYGAGPMTVPSYMASLNNTLITLQNVQNGMAGLPQTQSPPISYGLASVPGLSPAAGPVASYWNLIL